MATFIYIASTKEGKTEEGEMEAKDQAMVLAYLEKHELFPISIKERKKTRSLSLSISLFEHVSVLDKVAFSRNLATMIKAGIGIAEAIDIMLDDAEKPIMKKILGHVKMTLEKGGQLSEGLAKFPRHFPLVFLSLLKAGEASGNLENALMQIATQLKKESELKKKVKSAMAYPAILLFATFGVVVLLVTFVLPRVAGIFAQSRAKLPLVTRTLLSVSDFAAAYWMILPIFAGALVFLFIAVRRTETGRILFYAVAGKIPVLKSLIQKIALARLTNSLGSLLRAGIPIVKALEITATAVSHVFYRKALLDMTQSEIVRGVSLGMSLKRRPEYFPRLLTSMVVVGEKSGSLEMVLETLSSYYEEEVDGTLKTLITLLEPLLLLIMGAVVAFLAFSIVVPIYQMIGGVR